VTGIVRYGTYIPHFRITRAALGGGKGERAVAGYDEVSISLAVEAAREALPGAPTIDTLLFGKRLNQRVDESHIVDIALMGRVPC